MRSSAATNGCALTYGPGRSPRERLDVGMQYRRLDQHLGPILKMDGTAGVAAPDRQQNLTLDHPALVQID